MSSPNTIKVEEEKKGETESQQTTQGEEEEFITNWD